MPDPETRGDLFGVLPDDKGTNNQFHSSDIQNQDTKGMFGQDVDTAGIQSYRADPNAFQYGGRAGGADQAAGRYQALAASADQRQGPMMNLEGAQAAGRQQRAALGQMSTLQGQLQNQIAGNGPSVAQQQMQRGLGQAQMQAASTAASARGGGSNLAAAQRMGAQQQGQLAAQAVEAGGQLRAQEQLGALGQSGQVAGAYGGLASQMRGQSAQEQQTQASLGLQGTALNDQRSLAEQGMANQVNSQQLQAQMAQQQLNSQDFNQAQSTYYDAQKANAANDQKSGSGLFGGIVSGIGGVLSLSDGAQKTGIQPESSGPGDAKMGDGPSPDARLRSASSAFAAAGQAIAMSDRRAKDAAYMEGARDLERSMTAMYNAPTALGGRGRVSDRRAAALGRDADRMRGEWEGLARSAPVVGQGGAPSEMLDRLEPYSYQYKPGVPGEDPRERHYGIMAQDLEKSPMGRSLVRETPYGKAIDVKQAAGANLAASADLHDRLSALEAAYQRNGAPEERW